MAEFMVPVLLFANARFAMWDEILAAKAPPADFKYSTGIWHYARGLALLAKGRTADARQELRQLNALAEAMPADHVVGLNSAKTLLELASLVLAGQIASEDGHKQEAVRDLRRAVEIQDRLQYEEPPAWYYPVRQTLGAELLRQGRAAEAEVVFREDLKRNPENGWSLYGLAEALRARGADDEAAAVDARFKKAWADPEVTPRLSAVAPAATPSG
jgi:tetratricopeptide (TPR) repeat protein